MSFSLNVHASIQGARDSFVHDYGFNCLIRGMILSSIWKRVSKRKQLNIISNIHRERERDALSVEIRLSRFTREFGVTDNVLVQSTN